MTKSIPLEEATVSDIRTEKLNNGSEDQFDFALNQDGDESAGLLLPAVQAFVDSSDGGETEGLLLPAVQAVYRDSPRIDETDAEAPSMAGDFIF